MTVLIASMPWPLPAMFELSTESESGPDPFAANIPSSLALLRTLLEMAATVEPPLAVAVTEIP